MSPIQTIREALELFERLNDDSNYDHGGCFQHWSEYDLPKLIAALAELEKQKPVACLHFTDEQISKAMDGSGFHLYGVSPGAPLYAAPVAQQPQARPDFTDEWTGYLKDGETPFERFLRERKDLDALTKLYQRALEENERLKAQQPQAESLESLLSTAIGLLMGYEDRDGKVKTCNPYKPGSVIAKFVAECVERLKDWPGTPATQQPQAEAVPQKPKLIGWRTSDYLMETADKAMADNWSVHHEMLPIFEGDPYTKLAAAPKGQP